MAIADDAERAESAKAPAARPPNRLFRNLAPKIALIPMALTAVVIFLGGTLWTVVYSFTGSGLLPRLKWVGLDQYDRLWNTERWMVSIENLVIYGVLIVVFLIYEPLGLFGLWLRIRNYWKGWPFSY